MDDNTDARGTAASTFGAAVRGVLPSHPRSPVPLPAPYLPDPSMRDITPPAHAGRSWAAHDAASPLAPRSGVARGQAAAARPAPPPAAAWEALLQAAGRSQQSCSEGSTGTPQPQASQLPHLSSRAASQRNPPTRVLVRPTGRRGTAAPGAGTHLQQRKQQRLSGSVHPSAGFKRVRYDAELAGQQQSPGGTRRRLRLATAGGLWAAGDAEMFLRVGTPTQPGECGGAGAGGGIAAAWNAAGLASGLQQLDLLHSTLEAAAAQRAALLQQAQQQLVQRPTHTAAAAAGLWPAALSTHTTPASTQASVAHHLTPVASSSPVHSPTGSSSGGSGGGGLPQAIVACALQVLLARMPEEDASQLERARSFLAQF